MKKTKILMALIVPILSISILCGSSPVDVEYTDHGVIIHSRMVYDNRLILSDEEWDELMRLAIAEAGNQGVKGQALVMRVVLNRWQSGRYGETIHEVIFAHGQFYDDGMYRSDLQTVWEGNLTPGQRRQILDAYNAKAWVEYGWDESEGALYFCANGWNYYGDEHLFKYGGHWFSK